MAGEDLLEGDDGGTNDTDGAPGKKGKKKPLSKGQKIGVAIGLVTIVLFIYEIQKNKSASSSSGAAGTTSTIDPQTGYPSGSAADQAALSQLSGSSGGGYYGSGGYYTSPSSSSTDPFQGVDPSSGATYASELNTLGSDYSGLNAQLTTLEQQAATWSSTGNTTTPGSSGPTAAQKANLSHLEAELSKDRKINTPSAKAAVTRLNKQITAVKARS